MAKGKMAKMNLQDDKKEQEEFNHKLDELVKRYMIDEQDKPQAMKEAVNF